MTSSVGEHSLMEALECPVCKDFFTEPKQLECGHTYCLECVDGLEKVPNIVRREDPDYRAMNDRGLVSSFVIEVVENKVQCPQCRKMCLVPNDGLSTNYAIKDMVEKFRCTVKLVNVDDGKSNNAMEQMCSSTQQPQKHCHSCAKMVLDTELFMCKDCNKPVKRQLFCALCVVRSHKQHTIVPLDCLATARDRELAAMRVEEILSHAKRVGEEARGMPNDISKQFETLDEIDTILAELLLSNEVLRREVELTSEQIAKNMPLK